VPPLLAELVGLDRLGVALGLVYTTQAPTVLIGPPLAGAMRAALGSYVPVWLCVGALMSLSPLVMLALPVFNDK
jgi:MCP family monocarboxylic acid transporter-like MFS transporter 13/MCP family monocarboxylic acid transporter-like MFS transporter 12